MVKSFIFALAFVCGLVAFAVSPGNVDKAFADGLTICTSVGANSPNFCDNHARGVKEAGNTTCFSARPTSPNVCKSSAPGRSVYCIGPVNKCEAPENGSVTCIGEANNCTAPKGGTANNITPSFGPKL